MTPLCVKMPPRGVLGWVVAGPGSDFSEEPVWECEPVTLESVVVSQCPPGPVTACAIASSTMCRQTMSDRLRFRQRMASIEILPLAFLRSK
jgi:hypothetical protein